MSVLAVSVAGQAGNFSLRADFQAADKTKVTLFYTLPQVHLPRDAALLKPHDPGHFERVLRARVAEPWHALKD